MEVQFPLGTTLRVKGELRMICVAVPPFWPNALRRRTCCRVLGRMRRRVHSGHMGRERSVQPSPQQGDVRADEHRRIDGASGVHDPAGNLTAAEDGYELIYDFENRLVEVKDDAGMPLATYTYDALGRRIAETKGSDTTHFYYDGQNVIAEYDAAGNLQRYYIHGTTYVDEHAEYWRLLGQVEICRWHESV